MEDADLVGQEQSLGGANISRSIASVNARETSIIMAKRRMRSMRKKSMKRRSMRKKSMKKKKSMRKKRSMRKRK